MWFDPVSSWVVALFASGVPWLSEKTTKSIPAEYWANKDLLYEDRMRGMSEKEIIRNVERGKYYIPTDVTPSYPVPHRDPNNKILIENSELYRNDVSQYGTYQASQWLEQGKYNLSKEELEMTGLRIVSKYNSNQFDYRNTEAVRQWQKAHDVKSK